MTRDRMTANLPSRNMKTTAAFYARLGFLPRYQGDGWMILARGPLEVEFFLHPDIDPRTSWFSACIRTGDLGRLFADFRQSGLSDDPRAIPRLTSPQPRTGDTPPMFALIDPDGSLIRCLGEDS